MIRAEVGIIGIEHEPRNAAMRNADPFGFARGAGRKHDIGQLVRVHSDSGQRFDDILIQAIDQPCFVQIRQSHVIAQCTDQIRIRDHEPRAGISIYFLNSDQGLTDIQRNIGGTAFEDG